MSTPPAPVPPAGSSSPAPDASHSFLVPPGSSSAAATGPSTALASSPPGLSSASAPAVESLCASLTRSASECALLSASLDSARAAVQSTLVTLRAVHEFVSAKEAAEKLLARVQADLVERETDLVVERNSRVAAEAYVAALRDQLDSETRRAAETIGQLRGELSTRRRPPFGHSSRL
ncbi:hypothetical protein H257_14331 [Aphanomyces astaci]|uniref:Uncharacterized protein n=1 Tax=Aphanomyces astaci TaxID=112090 RepID=W4FTA4_APHAT|nr:hypothetical protein H257_14331 [Aphanomyces astaci]ETV70166.1 hypothetical protein H257_14331 [Aphanomyces astaci]|eukprot:XP_009840397.1 hypothetical protein H257_14331 [Aphanomyces astaci]